MDMMNLPIIHRDAIEILLSVYSGNYVSSGNTQSLYYLVSLPLQENYFQVIMNIRKSK